eukprot:TRINITY_DN8371_c0_g1_i1.p1 TRINITY_DN8371_c0_g1~~TRINITY_DN8371_c0_g1_i1.p1  ORF type:complete len:208 (-),score=52.05 TRINITY_DN8371_c0_g1_i1:53-676(-)
MQLIFLIATLILIASARPSPSNSFSALLHVKDSNGNDYYQQQYIDYEGQKQAAIVLESVTHTGPDPFSLIADCPSGQSVIVDSKGKCQTICKGDKTCSGDDCGCTVPTPWDFLAQSVASGPCQKDGIQGTLWTSTSQGFTMSACFNEDAPLYMQFDTSSSNTTLGFVYFIGMTPFPVVFEIPQNCSCVSHPQEKRSVEAASPFSFFW